VQNLKEISDSVNKSTSGIQIMSIITVSLGSDKTFSTADVGASGTSWNSGAAPNYRGANYYKSSGLMIFLFEILCENYYYIFLFNN
jgi:hypothetical protein